MTMQAEHVTSVYDHADPSKLIANVVIRTDPLADHQRKLWADHENGSTLLGYVVEDPALLAGYRADRVVWSADPLFTTRVRQMYQRTF
jgi:hypothetical protein